MSNLGLTRVKNTEFRWGERTYVMGIVNLSPDSFSGDGISNLEPALEQASRMVSEGADILDIGGESTRPGAASVSVQEELRRVIPVIEKLAPEIKVPLSIDSSKYEVVKQALDAGASILNDQWGLKTEPRLAELAAARNLPIILMSNQRDKGGFDAAIKRDTAYYSDAVREVIDSLQKGMETALQAGVPRENIIIDPGIGFGKTWKYDLEIIRRLEELQVLERPFWTPQVVYQMVIFPLEERVEGTAAVAIGIANGADIVRVHDVKQMVRICKMSDAIVRGK
jgi:dihydropteroate synthase